MIYKRELTFAFFLAAQVSVAVLWLVACAVATVPALLYALLATLLPGRTLACCQAAASKHVLAVFKFQLRTRFSS